MIKNELSIEHQIRDWDRRMKSFPTFEEFRDVEWIRRSGKINMITGGLVAELLDNSRYEGAAWLKRCRANHCSWGSLWDLAQKTYEAKHGPKEDWFPDELVNEWEAASIDRELQSLSERKKILLSKKKHRIVIQCKI